MRKIDTINWQEFKVGDFFNFSRGTVGKMQTLDEGNTPVIAAARSNQGVAGYYDVDAPYTNKITISCNGVGCGSAFFHDYAFNVNGDAIVLIEKVPMSNKVKQYLACMLDGVFTRKYSYEEKCSPKKAKEEIIKLPSTADKHPDWRYMEQYMKSVEKKVNKDISLISNILGG